MSLSIETNNGSKTPNFVADETPTPTRFIRNCEEVGLFQDLNVNPFDEQFRRAAQVTTTVLTPPSVPSTDDVLHTPHVFPISTESDPASQQQLPPPKSANVRRNCLIPSLSTSECLTLPSPLITPLITITAPSEPHTVVDKIPEDSQKVPEAKNSKAVHLPGTKREKAKKNGSFQSSNSAKVATNNNSPSVNILPRPVLPLSPSSSNDPLTALLLRLPDGRLVQIPAIPVPTETAAPSRTSSTASPSIPTTKINPHSSSSTPVLSEAKLRLKQALTKTKTIVHPHTNSTPACVVSDASGTDTELAADCNNPNSRSKRRRGYNSTSDPDLEEEESEKRQKFLERNRAAAFRSRQKRKRWVSNLEAKTNAMNNANRMLQNEVLSLRTEVAQLKLQLLAHKDCPVTLAMCQPAAPTKNDHSSIVTSLPGLPISNAGVQSELSSRQIIILNTSNQGSGGVPSLTIVPRVDTNAVVSYNSNDGTRLHYTELGQQTSVITSTKTLEN